MLSCRCSNSVCVRGFANATIRRQRFCNISIMLMFVADMLNRTAAAYSNCGRIKVKTKGTPLWGTHYTPLESIKTLSFATITNVIGSAVNYL